MGRLKPNPRARRRLREIALLGAVLGVTAAPWLLSLLLASAATPDHLQTALNGAHCVGLAALATGALVLLTNLLWRR